MQPNFAIQTDYSLLAHNTLGIAAYARAYVALHNLHDVQALCSHPLFISGPRLVLGGGSNIVLSGDFPGMVLHVCLRGIAIIGETPDAVLVRAGAGEGWHDLVCWTLAQGLGGLENLSLIPGTVGAAPIQNIGAYGAELKQVLHSVSVYEWATGRVYTMSAAECMLGYRDSIFKQALKDTCLITEVILALPKCWQANLQYAELARAMQSVASPSAQQIASMVCSIRRNKLPDPEYLGNVGSFFKNPVVSQAQFAILNVNFPNIVSFQQADGKVKLAAAWLIEQCAWKGKRLGAVGVYEKQALVLVNHGGASGVQVLALAAQIQQDVQHQFGLMLVPEAQYI
jgi:UDP-N-acetylmuramate dehydrogenase